MDTTKKERKMKWGFLCGLLVFLLIATPAELYGRRGRGGDDSDSSGSSGRRSGSDDDSSSRSFDDSGGSGSGRRGGDDSSSRSFDDSGSGRGRGSGSSGSGRGRGRGRDDFFVLRTIGDDRPILAADLHGRRIIHRRRTEFVFFDRHHSVHHRDIHSDFFFLTSFDAGAHHAFVPVFPYHHRRFVFINPVGYWPGDYHYYRYYQYGCAPYEWYGPQPVPRQVGDTYNYYTYNYPDAPAAPLPAQAPGYTPPAEMPPQTEADRHFDTAARAFEAGDFPMAATQFALAYQAAPDDKVLPFAYAQALFAVGDYKLAAPVLSGAIARIKPTEEGIFYPRGLYADDDVLFAQIETLHQKAALNPTDADLQLLLGYHYLGLNELDNAQEPLLKARTDATSRGPAAQSLLQLLDTLKAEQVQAAQPQPEQAQPTPAAAQ